MLNPGRLNCRVTILQRSAATQDAAGQPSAAWSELATLWADVRAPSGTASAERLLADRDTALVAYSVRIRRRTDVTTGMRAQIDGATFDIAQVVHDHAGREFTDLVCVGGGVA